MNKFLIFKILVVSLLLGSCASPKKFVYLQDMVPGESYPVDIKHEALIMCDDRLKITVNSENFRVSADGNISTYSNGSSVREEGYRVDVDGYIDFPILGKLHVAGLTVNQAIDLIGTKIVEGNYMKDPLVSIEFLNFKYTVMGAVTNTGNYSVTGDRVTIFEALARAGGLTQKARLDRITVFREVGDSREMYVTDIRSKEIFNSPCYYLQQNDIVYAEPKYLKKDAEDRGWQIGTTVLSVVTAACSVLWAISLLN